MPDYLSCGACHAEFEVVDFYRFLDHKMSSCHVHYNGDQLSGAESVLECSKCLKKCRTPWSLLQHLQADHYMSLVRTLLLPSDSGGPAPYPAGGRQRSVDQNSLSEACTQTMRSCLKRQVCPYEKGLPDDCCLKASKEQLASDSGCCCMDSYGAGRGGGCGGGGCGGDGQKTTDCCLAVPKKRRLLPPPAIVNGNGAAAAAAVTAASGADAVATSCTGAVVVAACCGLKPDCDLQQQLRPANKRLVRSSDQECQTDFDITLLDLDVDMALLMEDAATAVDVPTSLVGDMAAAPTDAASPLSALSSAMRRPPPPAPSKAIQTVSRVAAGLPQPPPPPPFPLSPSSAFYCPTPAATMQQYQQQALQQDPAQYQLQQQPISLSLPPLGNGGGIITMTVGQLSAVRTAASRPKEMKYKCAQCTRSFHQNIHLRKHVMSQHSHSKPHKCPSCEYTTVEKSHLTVHIRKHTGERPFSCRDCDYSTAQNCTLKAHYLRKHPGSVVHCGRCGLDFVTEHERDKHERGCSTEPL